MRRRALAAVTGVVALPSLGEALASVLPPHRHQHVAANRSWLERGRASWVEERGMAGVVTAWSESTAAIRRGNISIKGCGCGAGTASP